MSEPASPDPASSPSPAAWAASSRMLSASLMSALVFIGLALSFVLTPLTEAPPLVVPLLQVAAGVAVHLALEAFGYRTPALATTMTEEDAAAAARARWQTLLVLRFAVSEFIAIASVAAAFLVEEGGFLTYVGGMVVSLVLMGLHVWPGARPVGKVADALERDGRRSGLREAFGLA